MCMPAYDPADDTVLDTPIHRVYPRHIQDRLDAREYFRDRVTMLQSKGMVAEAFDLTREQLDPLNEWLQLRGIGIWG